MPEHSLLLPELVLTYALALVLILALSRLRIPPIVSFIIAGTIAGPTGVGIGRTQEDVQPARRSRHRPAVVHGRTRVLAERDSTNLEGGRLRRHVADRWTAVAILLVVLLAAQGSWQVGIFIGLFVALSSTAIVLRELSSRNQLDAPHGRLMVGILLFQDLCIVALLLLVPIRRARRHCRASRSSCYARRRRLVRSPW